MITAEFELIDKKKADSYLSMSLGNPRWQKQVVDDRKVQRIVSDIQNGKWNTAGDSIKFDENGNFRDGHHRLTAISRCDIPCLVLVVRNVPEEALIHIDDNSFRTLSQRIHYPKTVLAMPGVFEVLITGKTRSRDCLSDNQKLKWIIEEHPLAEESYNIVSKQYNKKTIMKNSGCALGIMIAYEYGISRYDLERFTTAVIQGVTSGVNEHGIILLRDQLSERRSNSISCIVAEANNVQSALYDYLNGKNRIHRYSGKPGWYLKEMIRLKDHRYIRE